MIIADFEQQLCFTLGLYAFFIIVYKIGRIQKEEGLFNTDFFLVGKSKTEQEEPVDLKATLDVLTQSSRASSPAISTWIICIKRYLNTNNVQHAADSIKDSIELLEEELESSKGVNEKEIKSLNDQLDSALIKLEISRFELELLKE